MRETAIIVPVPEAEPAVGRWRREHTPGGSHGVPAHFTLLAPFTPPDRLTAGCMDEVRDVLREFRAFDYELREIRIFDSAPNRVLYLSPEPGEQLVAMIEAVVSRFPEHPPYGRPGLEPVPHLTVATGEDAALAPIELALRPQLPIAARGAEAWIIEYGNGRCTSRSRIALASARG